MQNILSKINTFLDNECSINESHNDMYDKMYIYKLFGFF